MGLSFDEYLKESRSDFFVDKCEGNKYVYLRMKNDRRAKVTNRFPEISDVELTGITDKAYIFNVEYNIINKKKDVNCVCEVTLWGKSSIGKLEIENVESIRDLLGNKILIEGYESRYYAACKRYFKAAVLADMNNYILRLFKCGWYDEYDENKQSKQTHYIGVTSDGYWTEPYKNMFNGMKLKDDGTLSNRRTIHVENGKRIGGKTIKDILVKLIIFRFSFKLCLIVQRY